MVGPSVAATPPKTALHKQENVCACDLQGGKGLLVRFQFNWTTGALGIQPISFALLGAGCSRAGPVAPYVITLAFPVGAFAFLRKRRSFGPRVFTTTRTASSTHQCLCQAMSSTAGKSISVIYRLGDVQSPLP